MGFGREKRGVCSQRNVGRLESEEVGKTGERDAFRCTGFRQ
jgi:hypothetical protein